MPINPDPKHWFRTYEYICLMVLVSFAITIVTRIILSFSTMILGLEVGSLYAGLLSTGSMSACCTLNIRTDVLA